MQRFGATLVAQIIPAAVLAVLMLPGVTFGEQAPYSRQAAKASFKRPLNVPCPLDNAPTTQRVSLGRALFFDPRLSGSNAISCATCHNPAFSWGDALPKGIGHGSKQLGRRTPTILNTAFADALFWDGRADSLEQQALGPIASQAEMNLPLDELVAKLRGISGYRAMFEAAYPREDITSVTIGKALASFERTVVSGTAPFDRWINGQEQAISASAKRGFDLFNTKANCVKCHLGWNFTDNGFHDIGLASTDIGRGKFLPILVLQNAFKTPTLRDVDHRGPYMHDGSGKSLEEVVRTYNRGGEVARASMVDAIKPLNLTETEIADLCNFMHTLTSPDRKIEIAALPNP